MNKHQTSAFRKEWLTMNEAQELLDYSSRGPVYGFCKKYRVRVTKPRGRIYFNHTDLLGALGGSAVQMHV